MKKNKIYIAIAVIFILAFISGNLDYPQFLNLKYFPQKDFKLGLDLQGGIHLIYEADLSNIAEEDHESSMQGLRDVIERRVDFFGVAEPVVQVQNQRLIVELAGVLDSNQAIKMIGQTPFLEFREPKENYQEIIEQNKEEDPFQPTPLTGQYLKKAELGFDQTTGYQALVSLQFNDEGAKIFEELTERNLGKPLAIYIDGAPISIPTVQDKISGGKAQITGTFTVEEAKTLARNLNAGALPLPITLISQQSVGPTLGKVSLDKSLKAGIFGFLAVVLFMVVFYRLPGLLAVVALGVYTAIMLVLFKLIPVTLTAAGIAGFILSIGMAVDANILIFERMKEEFRKGGNVDGVMREGFSRAWSSIRDSNFSSIITAVILFWFSNTSIVKGFALIFGMGVLVSMFTAITVTRTFLFAVSHKRHEGAARFLFGSGMTNS